MWVRVRFRAGEVRKEKGKGSIYSHEWVRARNGKERNEKENPQLSPDAWLVGSVSVSQLVMHLVLE